jgi:hypothetical protein
LQDSFSNLKRFMLFFLKKKKKSDPRSPSLGIHRSPLKFAKRWSFATMDPIVSVPIVHVSKEKEEQYNFDVEEPVAEVTRAVVARDPVVEGASSFVDSELEKLRLEFSAKKKDAGCLMNSPMVRSAKQFLSSPALWKTISSPMVMDSPVHHVSDPLLRDWQSPAARRNLFGRQESAGAA